MTCDINIEEMKLLIDGGMKIAEVAEYYNCSVSTINKRLREIWNNEPYAPKQVSFGKKKRITLAKCETTPLYEKPKYYLPMTIEDGICKMVSAEMFLSNQAVVTYAVSKFLLDNGIHLGEL